MESTKEILRLQNNKIKVKIKRKMLYSLSIMPVLSCFF